MATIGERNVFSQLVLVLQCYCWAHLISHCFFGFVRCVMPFAKEGTSSAFKRLKGQFLLFTYTRLAHVGMVSCWRCYSCAFCTYNDSIARHKIYTIREKYAPASFQRQTLIDRFCTHSFGFCYYKVGKHRCYCK